MAKAKSVSKELIANEVANTSMLSSIVNQVTQPAIEQPTNTEKTIKNAMNIKALLESVGITVTDEQVDLLSASLTYKASKSGSNIRYSHGQVKLEPTDKIALQARIALENLTDGMSLETWAQMLSLDKRFVTKQQPAKIIAYYQKSLIEAGYLVKSK